MSGNPTLPAFSTIYAFGDSLSDAGNLSLATTALGSPTPVAPPYYQETYSTAVGPVTANVFSNGPTWVQNLSLDLGLGTLEPSAIGGNDFAYGGAETGPTPQNAGDPKVQAISLPSQLEQFQTEDPHPSANALYTLSIGANDILDILNDPSLSTQQQTTDVSDAVANEMTFLEGLVSDGAKDFLVMDVPDLGITPEVTQGLANGSDTPSAALDSLATNLASEYNADLASQLGTLEANDHVNVDVLNAFALTDHALADPTAYGLTNVTTPVWSGNYTDASSGTLAATGAAQDQYLFFDHFHPTERGELALAAWAEAALAGVAPPPCFAAGTLIATERGEVAVEHLAVGDRVRLAEGGTAPVVWLGQRRVACRRHPNPDDVQPVRIAAHAFGLDRPRHDLRVSPDHAVFVEGVLIPVRYLLNAATVQQEDVASVTYWHVELPAHGVLLAEGLPAESYLDTGNRGAFANGAAALMAQPDFSRAVWERQGCAPLVTEGPVRDLVYRRLLAQAFALGWELRDAGGGASEWAEPQRMVAG
jgi:phospholipase/lecithinase/hemolysin